MSLMRNALAAVALIGAFAVVVPAQAAGKTCKLAIAGNDLMHPAARILFERLWQYDQVVFDTSQV